MTGFRNSGRARGPSRDVDTGGIKQHQESIAFATREAEVRIARQSIVRIAVQHCRRDNFRDTLDHAVAQIAQSLGTQCLRCYGFVNRHGEGSDTGGVEGAGTHFALLPAAMLNRDKREISLGDERTHAVRSADLVTGDCDGIDT
jgi:hypothetical protein